MGTRALKLGDYVQWFESYDDGISGKDFGKGIIVDITKYESIHYDNCKLYQVYRQKHQDFCWFENCELKIIEKKNEDISDRV
jgi:hypothetical protein